MGNSTARPVKETLLSIR